MITVQISAQPKPFRVPKPKATQSLTFTSMSFGSCIRASLPLKFTIRYSKQYGLPIRDIHDLLSFDITLYIFSVILLISFYSNRVIPVLFFHLPQAAAVVHSFGRSGSGSSSTSLYRSAISAAVLVGVISLFSFDVTNRNSFVLK